MGQLTTLPSEYRATAFSSANQERVQCVADSVSLDAIPWDRIYEYLC